MRSERVEQVGQARGAYLQEVEWTVDPAIVGIVDQLEYVIATTAFGRAEIEQMGLQSEKMPLSVSSPNYARDPRRFRG